MENRLFKLLVTIAVVYCFLECCSGVADDSMLKSNIAKAVALAVVLVLVDMLLAQY